MICKSTLFPLATFVYIHLNICRDKVGDTVDALWDKIEKAADNVVTLQEMAAFFAGYDGGKNIYVLNNRHDHCPVNL